MDGFQSCPRYFPMKPIVIYQQTINSFPFSQASCFWQALLMVCFTSHFHHWQLHCIRESACIFYPLCNFMKVCWCHRGKGLRRIRGCKRSFPFQPLYPLVWWISSRDDSVWSSVPRPQPFQREPQVGDKRQNQVFSLPPDPTICHPSSAPLWPGGCGVWSWQRKGAPVTQWPGVGREQAQAERQLAEVAQPW